MRFGKLSQRRRGAEFFLTGLCCMEPRVKTLKLEG